MSTAHHKSIAFALGALLLMIVITSGYYTISDLAGKQSQEHQQSISPVFSLIENELLEPLQIARTLAKAGIYDDVFLDPSPEQTSLLNKLKHYENKFDLSFYLAHDKSRKQYNSDGRVFDLIEGEVIWYFALKNETDHEVQAVLGNRDDVHLYVDVRQYDEYGNFLGFVGVGKSLSDFITSFEQFRQDYGHEFVFVNNKDEIVLSSLDALSPSQATTAKGKIGIKGSSDIPWFSEFNQKANDEHEPSVIVNEQSGDLLVSKLNLESLDWSLYILTPLNQRQQAVNESFTLYSVLGVLGVLLLYKLISVLSAYWLNRFKLHINRDPLTKLANRKYADIYFNKARREHRQMALVLADLDDFKCLNDTYGHAFGDHVLVKTAELFEGIVAEKGLVVRWGGEEFAIILPDTSAQEAQQIANRLRVGLHKLNASGMAKDEKITGSFGVFASRQYMLGLNAMVETADKSMYRAKKNGKNTVATFQDEEVSAAEALSFR